jgi:hypothetical protein
MRRLVALAVPIALAALVAGCSSSPAKAKIKPPSLGKGVAHVGHVGATLDLKTQKGNLFSVTLTKIVDPAQYTGTAATVAAERFVGLSFTIDNTSGSAITPDAVKDAVVVVEGGQIYSDVNFTLSDCPALPRGHLNIAPGSSSTGCVAFEIPMTASITEVQFEPAAGGAGNYGEWQNP